MFQIFEQLMIDFELQFALHISSKRKLSGVLSVGNAFEKFPCEIAWTSSEVHQSFSEVTDATK